MNKKNETTEKIQEIQILEQNLQSLVMQKQTFQLEFNEVTNAISELNKSSDEVYRILGGIMIKSDKKSLLNELEEKKKVLELRINSIEKQEQLLEKKADELRKDLTKSMSESKKQ